MGAAGLGTALALGLLGAALLGLARRARRQQARHETRLAALLRELERERAHSLFPLDDSRDLLCRYDGEGAVQHLSERGAALLGWAGAAPPRELRDFVDERCVPALLAWAREPAPGASDTDSEHLELSACTRSGARLWLDAQLRRLTQQGATRGAELVATDVTARRVADQSLAAYAGAVRSLDQSIAHGGPLEGALETLARQLGFDYAELWWLDAQRAQLRMRALWHVPSPALEQTARAAASRSLGKGQGLAGRSWERGAALYHEALAGDPGLREQLELDPGFGAALAFPVRLLGRTQGVLTLLSHERGAALAPATELLDTLGSQIGQFAERKAAEERIHQSELRTRTVLDSTIDCVITTDKDGRILEFNRAAELTFHYEREAVLGRNVAELIIPPALRPAHAAGVARYLETGQRRLQGRIESTALRADGSEFPIEVAVTPVGPGADPVFTAFVRDISDRRELEKIKDELVSTVSHELRTPLASVRGFVELLLVRDYSRDDQRKFLSIIDTEIKRLTRLINDFLDVQRMEMGKAKYDLDEHDLCALLRECVEVAAGSAGNHRFEVELPARPLRVRVDSDRMHQVVMNLLSNAVKFSPKGGTVFVRACAHNERAAASVRDEGMGMAPDVVQNLFRKFYRADNRLSREIEGTGLGLALAREIITAHGGEISVESQPGAGSEFFFNLPLLPDAKKKTPPPA